MWSIRKSLTHRLFATFSIVLVALAMTSASMPSLAVDKQVNQLEMKARESFAAGRYDEALQTFAKLYAETLHPVYLRNIGRCHQKMRDPQKAIDAFQDYLAKTKSGKDKITADERTEIEGYIKDMEALRASTAAQPVPPPPPPVQPTPPPVQPIQNSPSATPVPGLAQPTPTDQPPGLVAAAPPPDESHPVYTKWWFWTIVGAVVVGGVVTAVALSSGSSGHTCPAGVTCPTN